MNPIKEIRKFNRFYTSFLGVLNQHILDSPFSLTEARVLYEIGNTENCTATRLVSLLNMDRGYLSRLLKKFQTSGLVQRSKAGPDNRVFFLALTDKGKAVLSELIRASDKQISRLLAGVAPNQQIALVKCMKELETILSRGSGNCSRIAVRQARLGDMSYVAHRHCDICSRQHGFDEGIESYLLLNLAQFAEKRAADRDRLWVSDADDMIVGSIAVAGVDSNSAEIRWFLVEDAFRNHGLGKRLLATALEFCRSRYTQVSIQTFNSPDSARHVYQRFGFRLKETQPLFIWGRNVDQETWDLRLPPSR